MGKRKLSGFEPSKRKKRELAAKELTFVMPEDEFNICRRLGMGPEYNP